MRSRLADGGALAMCCSYCCELFGSISLPLRRPGKIDILVAGIETDVAIHFQIAAALLRIPVDRAGIGHVPLVLIEVLQGQCLWQDVHGLRNAFSLEPIRGVLPHGVAENRRGEADA